MKNQKYFDPGSGNESSQCLGFDSNGVFMGLTNSTYNFTAIEGSLVSTKVRVVSIRDNVGLILFKRLVTHRCTGHNALFCSNGTTVGDVYKTSVCVRFDHDVFTSNYRLFVNAWHRQLATWDSVKSELQTFAQASLPDAINQTDGGVKEGNRCNDADMRAVTPWIVSF